MRYRNAHPYQYRPGNSTRTRRQGCVWISLAAGVDAQSGGKRKPTPDEVLALVRPTEETNPITPGWSLPDAARAMARLKVPFVIRSGQGWAAVRQARRDGLYVVLQGDSDRFPDGCSGAFDGDHCIGIHPDDGPDNGLWRIDDPICATATYQPEERIRAYAEKFAPRIAFGVFTAAVPTVLPDTSTGGEMPGLLLTSSKRGPARDGTVTFTPGDTVIRVSDRKRVAIPIAANRPGLGPIHSVDLGIDGYLVYGLSSTDQEFAWIHGTQVTFKATDDFNAGVDAAVVAARTARR